MATKNAQTIIAELTAKGYTATQVYNSVRRSCAHVERTVKNPVVKSTWRKAEKDARHALEVAHAQGFVPCNTECMEAHVDQCICYCGGVNHGVALQAKTLVSA